MASIGTIIGYELPNNSAEDSWDLSDLFLEKKASLDSGREPIREAIVHHSSTGKFAIRQGKWKMIPQLGSGGWTQPVNVKPEMNNPEGQLYDLFADPGESDNLWEKHPDVVEQLSKLLEKYKKEGRSVDLKK